MYSDIQKNVTSNNSASFTNLSESINSAEVPEDEKMKVSYLWKHADLPLEHRANTSSSSLSVFAIKT